MEQNKIIEKMMSYIAGNLDKDLCLEILSKEFHYSKYYISRVFLKNTGYTIYQYIKEQRLAKAARELTETKRPIVEIAYEAHYQSQQAFTFAFHQRYQISPQEYRKNKMNILAFSAGAFGQSRKHIQTLKGRAAA